MRGVEVAGDWRVSFAWPCSVRRLRRVQIKPPKISMATPPRVPPAIAPLLRAAFFAEDGAGGVELAERFEGVPEKDEAGATTRRVVEKGRNPVDEKVDEVGES